MQQSLFLNGVKHLKTELNNQLKCYFAFLCQVELQVSPIPALQSSGRKGHWAGWMEGGQSGWGKSYCGCEKNPGPSTHNFSNHIDEDEAEAKDIASLHIHGVYRVVNPPIKKRTLSAVFFCVPPSNCRLGGFGVAQATAFSPPF